MTTANKHFRIEHIDDVLPHIEGRSDFVVADKGDYKVIDYIYTTADTFDNPARIECRGLKFGLDGKIIARPFAKFFNINERPETQAGALDFTQPHTIMEKLDGSMIHPAIIGGEVVFMTRMGRTDVALKAERHLTPELAAVCRGLLHGGATPIFEWTAPDNRIVVRYDDSALTLLAVRNTVDGEYWPHSVIAGMGLPSVRWVSPIWQSGAAFLDYARAVTGSEGFVVRFDNGLWIKAKGEDYVLKHKAKDCILQEKNVLALVLSGGLDDVLPLLDGPDADAACAYRDAVEAGLAATADTLERFVVANDNVDQKAFAVDHVPKLPPAMRPLAFVVRKSGNAGDAVRATLAAKTTSQSTVDEFRSLHGATWRAA